MPWTTTHTIPHHKSTSPPALAEFGGRLHMVHLGDSSNDIWHSTFNGTSWTANVKIPNQKSKASPALAAFGGRLQMVHLGDSSNDIWHSNVNCTSWTPNVKIPNQKSKAPPAQAELGGRPHLVLPGDSSNDIWHSNFNGTSWTPNVKIPNQQSKAPPALAAFGGRLHMVHLGNTSNDIWYSTFDGTSWTANVKIPDQKSKAAPALATFTDVCGRETLAMVHLGDSSNKIWYSQLAGSVWTRNYYVIGQLSKSSPGLARFGSRLHMVHQGDTSNDLWHSSTEGLRHSVRMGIKILRNPSRFSIHQMLYEMASVYATVGFQVVEVNRQNLNLPALEIVDVGSCSGSNVTAEQTQLFSNRAGLAATDVAAYFVEATVPALNGCAAHPVGVPALVVASGASQWTLGHETGHVLGLSHVSDSHNLMFGGGTDNITNPPPILTASQASTMRASGFAHNC
jgi:hypothetical protein